MKLNEKSLKKLKKVKPEFQKVVRLASENCELEFQISEGLRTLERQKKLKAQGKSHLLRSKHLTGDAVDVFVVKNGKACWEYDSYVPVAEAFKKASKKLKTAVRWGGAWSVEPRVKLDIRTFKGSLKKATELYKKLRGRKKAFIDAVHFELL